MSKRPRAAPKVSRRRRRNPEAPPSYRAAHWGLLPTAVATYPIQEPGDNEQLTGLGWLYQVVYVTTKAGDKGPTEYIHTFDEKNPPLLAYGSDDGRLYVVGGGYVVRKHGIID